MDDPLKKVTAAPGKNDATWYPDPHGQWGDVWYVTSRGKIVGGAATTRLTGGAPYRAMYRSNSLGDFVDMKSCIAAVEEAHIVNERPPCVSALARK